RAGEDPLQRLDRDRGRAGPGPGRSAHLRATGPGHAAGARRRGGVAMMTFSTTFRAPVIPAKAGPARSAQNADEAAPKGRAQRVIQCLGCSRARGRWTPAFAGVTSKERVARGTR